MLGGRFISSVFRSGDSSAEFEAMCARAYRENGTLRAENAELRADNVGLGAENVELRSDNTAFRKQVAFLEERLVELERMVKKDCNSSHKPPSQSFRKPISQRRSGQNVSGGQRGHKGAHLVMREDPDYVEKIAPQYCEACGKDLSNARESKVVQRGQVVDIPKPRSECTEYQALGKACSCGHVTKCKLPQGVKCGIQYGPNVRTIVGYLHVQHLVPEDRTAEILGDAFGLPMCAATVGNITIRMAEELRPVVKTIHKEIETESVKHLDETGMRVTKKSAWMHVISTSNATVYKFEQKRGSIFCPRFGTVVHDGLKSYYKLENVNHALCGAHLLRELEAIRQYDKECWASDMKELLQTTCHRVNQQSIGCFYKWQVSKKYDVIVKKGLAYHLSLPPPISKSGRKKRPGHNLLLRLQNFKPEVLLFMSAPEVPFTNNLAERDLRMMKVKQKISGGFRSEDGASNFCTIRSFMWSKTGYHGISRGGMNPKAV